MNRAVVVWLVGFVLMLSACMVEQQEPLEQQPVERRIVPAQDGEPLRQTKVALSGPIAPAAVNAANFHPGHYLLVHPRTSLTALKKIEDAIHFVGAKKKYIWRDLEPEEGTYDFSEIETDLAYCNP